MQFHNNTRFTEKEKSERTEDALASAGEEGRGKLRKGPGICKQELIRTYPNGATRTAEGRAPMQIGANPGN